MDDLLTDDALEVQAAYVDCFDRGRRTSLHLFEHVHGDARDRGPAMIDLQQTYREGVMRLDGVEPALREAAALLRRARDAGIPVIHVRHDAGPGYHRRTVSDRASRLLLGVATIIAVAALYVKQPQAFHLPQFYAEEGRLFFADAYNDGWPSLV